MLVIVTDPAEGLPPPVVAAAGKRCPGRLGRLGTPTPGTTFRTWIAPQPEIVPAAWASGNPPWNWAKGAPGARNCKGCCRALANTAWENWAWWAALFWMDSVGRTTPAEPLASMAIPFRLVTDTLTEVVVDTVATVLVAEWELETLKVTELTED